MLLLQCRKIPYVSPRLTNLYSQLVAYWCLIRGPWVSDFSGCHFAVIFFVSKVYNFICPREDVKWWAQALGRENESQSTWRPAGKSPKLNHKCILLHFFLFSWGHNSTKKYFSNKDISMFTKSHWTHNKELFSCWPLLSCWNLALPIKPGSWYLVRWFRGTLFANKANFLYPNLKWSQQPSKMYFGAKGTPEWIKWS